MTEHHTTETDAADLVARIRALKDAKNALILAHFYQDEAIQALADHTGDSLELARLAARAPNDVIVLAGVSFMAETAKILKPESTVLIPDAAASCSLVEETPTAAFRAYRAAHPDTFIITYVNSSAEVKALSDVCCTSSNALAIVARAPRDRPVLFGPDRNLGRWVRAQSDRPDIALWDASCEVHVRFSADGLRALMARYPDAQVLAHPECEEAVLACAHVVGSTAHLLRTVADSPAARVIVATEPGILYQMRRRAPHKEFIPAPAIVPAGGPNVCRHMRLHTLDKLHAALRDGAPAVTLPADLMEAARRPIVRMLDWS